MAASSAKPDRITRGGVVMKVYSKILIANRCESPRLCRGTARDHVLVPGRAGGFHFAPLHRRHVLDGYFLSDAAARAERRLDLHPLRPQHGDQIVENCIGHVLVEDALVAKALQVELEALQLDAPGPR